MDRKLLKKRVGEVFGALLMAAVLMILPAIPQNAYAEDTQSSPGSFGTSGIENPGSESGVWNKVYFGSKGDVICFNVLNTSETCFGGNTMLLDCESVLFKSIVYDSYRQYWYHSKVRIALNGPDRSKESEDSFITQRFTDAEKAAIISSKKNEPSSTDGKGRTEGYGYAEEYGATSLEFDTTEGSKLFALDAMEMTNATYGFSADPNASSTRKKKDTDGNLCAYWLRSPSATSLNKTGIIGTSGVIGSTKVSEEHGVSPALNINLSKIMFNNKLSDGSFKLTIQDSEMRIKANYALRDENRITVPYTLEGGRKGNVNRISVLMLDKEWSNSSGTWNTDATIKYYAHLDDDGSFELPSNFDSEGPDWKIYIIAEQVNDGKATDYASAPLELTKIENTIDYTSSGFTGYYDAEQHAITVNVTEPSGATIQYGTEEGNYAFDKSPAITEVDESPLTVYYKITSDGYHTVTGSETVTINPVSVDSVSIDNDSTEATLDYSDAENRDLTLTATVSPELAYNKTISWSSSDESVATVDEDGNVRALKEGEATITVTTKDGTKTDTFFIRSRHDTDEDEMASYGYGDSITVEYGETIKLTNDVSVELNYPYWEPYKIIDGVYSEDTAYSTYYDLTSNDKNSCTIKNHNPGTEEVTVIVSHTYHPENSSYSGSRDEHQFYTIKLMPQRCAVTYKVKLPGADGFTDAGKEYVNSGSDASGNSTAASTIKDGDDTYVLDGWYADEYCSTSADLSALTDYMTVYGKYNNGQKVHYDLNLTDSCLEELDLDARTAPDDQPGNVSDSKTISAPTSCGAVREYFDSWNTRPDGSGDTYKPDENYILTANKDLNLYAIWKYTIHFEVLTSQGVTSPADVVVLGGKNTSGVLPNEESVKTGYKFIRWQDVVSKKYYTPGDTISFDEFCPMLRPEFKIIKYKISYDLDGGSLADGVSNKTYYYVDDESFTLNVPVKDGCVFEGWTGTGLEEATKTVTVSKGSTENREYKANWTEVEWNEPTYTWSDDYSSVTATRSEKNGSCPDETETVNTTSEIVAATCEECVKTIYTASFTNEAFESQTKEVKNEEYQAIGHDWGDPVYKWADDYSAVTARRVCGNDVSHIEEEETTQITLKVTKPATSTENGEMTYTATFENSAFEAQTLTVEIEATGPEPGSSDDPSSSESSGTAAQVVVGSNYEVDGNLYNVTKVAIASAEGTVTFVKAKNAKTVTVPKTVVLADGNTYIVNAVGPKAFTASKIRTIKIGANVETLYTNAFTKTKATKMIVKTKKLTKASVKGCLKTSKIKIVKVKVGKKSVNKKFVKKYKKIFTKKNAGRKVTVRR